MEKHSYELFLINLLFVFSSICFFNLVWNKWHRTCWRNYFYFILYLSPF